MTTNSIPSSTPLNTRSLTSKRKHWGEFTDDVVELKRELKANDIVSAKTKLEHLKKLQAPNPVPVNRLISLDNPVVTQTIEVMNQTEVIQSMIDTYTSNNTGNPCVLMPHIDFPPDNTARLVRDDKFLKPLWYIPPLKTTFTQGVPVRMPTLSKPVVYEAMRKSISGLLRLKGFYETNDSALVMLTDGLDEFYKCLLASLNDVLVNESRDTQKTLDVSVVERGYFQQTRNSLTSLHNYHKNDIVQRNCAERREFQEIFNEYDRLMKQSQNLHKNTIKQEDEYMSMLDFSGTTAGTIAGGAAGETHIIQHADHAGGVVNIMNFLDGDLITNAGGFQANFDGNTTNLVGKTITTITNADELNTTDNTKLRFGPQSQ